eukprot:3976367-Pleurochrysis_carterae.AAC.1
MERTPKKLENLLDLLELQGRDGAVGQQASRAYDFVFGVHQRGGGRVRASTMRYSSSCMSMARPLVCSTSLSVMAASKRRRMRL